MVRIPRGARACIVAAVLEPMAADIDAWFDAAEEEHSDPRGVLEAYFDTRVRASLAIVGLARTASMFPDAAPAHLRTCAPAHLRTCAPAHLRGIAVDAALSAFGGTALQRNPRA